MSDSFTNNNIDPTLHNLNVNDPNLAMLARLRAGGIGPPLLPSLPSTPGDDMDQFPATPRPSIGRPPLVAFGSMVKSRFKFSDKSAVAFDQFMQLQGPEERNVVLFAQILELVDLVRKNEKADVWTIPSALMKKINVYTQALILSPELNAYRGLNMAEHILKAMRECNLPDVPPEAETADVDLVLSRIREKGTHWRNVLKSLVKTSLEPKSDLENIAALAHKLVQGGTIKATLQLYVRLAFIRFIMVEYPWLTEETFWLKVDETIAENAKSCTESGELDQLYNLYYQQDIEAHGDPSNTPHQTADFNSTSTTWQTVVRRHSANIQPNPRNAQVLQNALTAWAAQNDNPLKRRRVDEGPDGSVE
ncbi:hypothetical protein C8R46DRAFT_45701 [Mycena filopes]|nr:hypothetical protein C8R46DRAFT_45701 [Mycena filopes]